MPSSFDGQGILAALRKLSYEDEMDIVQTFELQKGKILHDQTKPVVLRLPVLGLSELTRDLFGQSIAEILKRSDYGDKISIKRDIVTIDADVLKRLFQPAIDRIIGHVENLMKKSNVVNCKQIWMVGGFSESSMLQEAIRKAFPECKVIIPAEAGLAVLKGAVMFGHDPAVISERICRYTYGTDVTVPFKDGEHPESKRQFFGSLCKDMFHPFVNIGDCLKVGQPSHPISLFPLFDFSTEMNIDVFASKNVKPEFVTDDGCHKVGKVVVPMPDTGETKKTEVRLILGGTEMQVECNYVNTGEVTRGYINFLG